MENQDKPDKYKAVWLSHSSISDFLKCPRLYYLRNVYKDPRTGHKMNIITPPLALGQVVHEVVEGLSVLPVEERLSVPLIKKFEKTWEKIGGEKGGFRDDIQEKEYKDRGIIMLQNLEKDPGPILRKAIKIKSEMGLPNYWFSEEENIILCGKIDWIEYLESSDSIHIIDFKTSKKEESDSSLQLPVYLLLATNTQARKVEKASYWYLDIEAGLKEVTLPSVSESTEKISKIGSRIKLARQLNRFVCKDNGCKYCYSFERILKGEGKKVFVDDINRDIYILQ